MALFILTCIDKPGALDIRMATREAHLAYVRERMDMVKLAGPRLTDDGQMAGSMLILEVADKAAAQAFADGDPYGAAGLFERVELTPFRVTIGSLSA